MRLCQAIFQKLEFFHVARYEVCNSDHVDNLIDILGAGQKMDKICRNFGANRFSYSFGYCKRLANRKCEEEKKSKSREGCCLTFLPITAKVKEEKSRRCFACEM